MHYLKTYSVSSQVFFTGFEQVCNKKTFFGVCLKVMVWIAKHWLVGLHVSILKMRLPVVSHAAYELKWTTRCEGIGVISSDKPLKPVSMFPAAAFGSTYCRHWRT